MLAVLLFIRNVTATTTVAKVTSDYVNDGYATRFQGKEIPDYVAIYRIHGPFLFGRRTKSRRSPGDRRAAAHRRAPPEHDRESTPPGCSLSKTSPRRCHRVRPALLFCGAREQPRKLDGPGRLRRVVGRENMCDNVLAAAWLARKAIMKGGPASPEA